MSDYYPVISRAVIRLGESTEAERQAIYERARTALDAQLRGRTPAFSELEIGRQRRALANAIDRAEMEAKASPSERLRAAPTVKDQVIDLSKDAVISNRRLELCTQCCKQVEYDEGRFCPCCGYQPLLTIGGSDISRYIKISLAYVFSASTALSCVIMVAIIAQYTISKVVVLLGIATSTISIFLTTLIIVASTLDEHMKANMQSKTMMDRSTIRERIILKTAFFGVVALVVPNYFLHGALLSFGSDPRLAGVILGGLGCGIGAGIGHIIGC
jgi:hypothetical protein